MNMNWKSAKQLQPRDNQEVLIRCNGQINLAIFDAGKNGYKLKDGSVCRPNFDPIEWVEADAIKK
jgi:hypothetical protein